MTREATAAPTGDVLPSRSPQAAGGPTPSLPAAPRPSAGVSHAGPRRQSGSTPAFLWYTGVVALAAVALAVAVSLHPPAARTAPWYPVVVTVLYLAAFLLPVRTQRILDRSLGDMPDISVGIPLLALAPFPLFAGATAVLVLVLSLRLGLSRANVVFNLAQSVLACGVAGAVVAALGPPAGAPLMPVGLLVVAVAALLRELAGQALTVLGLRLDGDPVTLAARDTLARHAANLPAVVVACAAVALATHGTAGAVLSVAIVLATLVTGEFAAREANQRWLAEAVASSGERIRGAETLDDVLDRLAQETAMLWRATDWHLRPATARVAAAGRGAGTVVLPLVHGQEIVLAHPAVGVPVEQMHRTSDALVRMAAERERVLQYQERLSMQATRDDLTGLGNRTRLWERLDQLLPKASSNNRVAAVFVDVDRFRSVNDAYGHGVGDGLLRAVARRMKTFTDRLHSPMRLSGDEFVVVVDHAPDDEQLLEWVERLRDELAKPYDVEGSVVNVSVCAGIAVAHDPVDRSTILAATDAAVTRAKKQGRGSVVLATDEVIDEARRRQQLEGALRTALATSEFALHYQPIVDTDAGRVRSVEALIRWYRDGSVWMRPDEFIQYAEEIGLISQIGLWVLRRACTQMKTWNERYRPDEPLSVSINVSTVHIAQPTFVADVARILEETGFPPELLIIEITETFALLDLDKSIALGAELKAMGVRLWLDDFGTGYSSLEYVRQLPVEVVKLDRSFIVDLGSNPTTRTFIESLVALCQSIDRDPMAEGVERPEQRALLAELGCVIQQGYHFARPMPVEELADYVLRADESVLPRRTA